MKNYFTFPGLYDGKILTEKRPEAIIETVCALMGTDRGSIVKRSRKREIILPRQICHYLIKKHFPKISYKEIGKLVGRKNHATIIHSCRAIKNLIETNDQYVISILNKVVLSGEIPGENQKAHLTISDLKGLGDWNRRSLIIHRC